MTTAVADATVLISLSKIGNLELLEATFEDVLVPDGVYAEVVERGRDEGYSDALAVDEATGAFLSVSSIPDDLEERVADVRASSGLGRGEAEAIVLARERTARCLTDDHAARTTADALGVPVGGTIYVLLEALASGLVSFDEYVSCLDELTDRGFRMSASLYRTAVDAGREIDAE